MNRRMQNQRFWVYSPKRYADCRLPLSLRTPKSDELNIWFLPPNPAGVAAGARPARRCTPRASPCPKKSPYDDGLATTTTCLIIPLLTACIRSKSLIAESNLISLPIDCQHCGSLINSEALFPKNFHHYGNFEHLTIN